MGKAPSSRFGLVTTIGQSPSSKFDKIRKWQDRFSNEAFRKKYSIKIVNEIKRICFSMHLPKNAEHAAMDIYRKARLKKVTNGRRFQWIAAASVYASCRILGFPRSLGEIAKASGLHRKIIGRTYLEMKRELKLHVDAVHPSTQLHRIAIITGVGHDIEDLAIKLLNRQNYSGKPVTLAATALYLASKKKGVKCQQSKLAKAAGISENTLRNCYRQYKTQWISV